jgi:hypothetical protein
MFSPVGGSSNTENQRTLSESALVKNNFFAHHILRTCFVVPQERVPSLWFVYFEIPQGRLNK